MSLYVMPMTVTVLFTSGYLMLYPRRFRLSSLRDDRDFFAVARKLAQKVGSVSRKSLMAKRKSEQYDRAIFDSICFVRNLIAADKSSRLTSDVLLEQLAATDSLLAPNYKRALARLRMGKKEEMAIAFAAETGTEAAQDFIRIILRWDEVQPEKLASTLQSYQCAVKESRTTRIKRSNEAFSDILYLPVILNVLLVLVNFLFVGYFIEQRQLIQQLFL